MQATNPAIPDGIEIRVVGDDVLVHDPTNDKIHVLNGTAGYVLQLCDGAHSIAEIARSLSAASGVDLGIVHADVETIVSEFTAVRLVSM